MGCHQLGWQVPFPVNYREGRWVSYDRAEGWRSDQVVVWTTEPESVNIIAGEFAGAETQVLALPRPAGWIASGEERG